MIITNSKLSFSFPISLISQFSFFLICFICFICFIPVQTDFPYREYGSTHASCWVVPTARSLSIIAHFLFYLYLEAHSIMSIFLGVQKSVAKILLFSLAFLSIISIKIIPFTLRFKNTTILIISKFNFL